MLTKQQKKLFIFIKDFQQRNGISPSYDEMRCALNQRSKSGVHMLLKSLVERGFIRKLQNKARAIEIINSIIQPLPMGLTESSLVRKENTLVLSEDKPINTDFVRVPFYGRQNTVFPLKTFLSSPEKIISVAKETISYVDGEDYCALQVSGDSLKEMAILDGDTLLFNMSSTPAPGQLALVLVDEEQIHIKKWEIKEGNIILSLGNKYMIPQAYSLERVRIKGTMIGLNRVSFGANGFYESARIKTISSFMIPTFLKITHHIFL